MFNLKRKKKNDGFTLLELLIVIAIIAILSVILVIVLNPAESLKKTRDAQRMSDLATLKKAIGLYVTMTPYPKLAGTDNTGCKGTTSDANTWQTSNDKIYYSYPSDIGGTGASAITATALDGVTFAAPGGVNQVLKANLGLTNGSGWIPIDFSSIAGGSPISVIPVDPINTIADKASPKSTDLVYRYICSEKNLTYEISATLESSAYTVADNKMAKDGGNADGYFESGTALSLLTSESTAPTSTLAIGDLYQGGKVAYLLVAGDPGYSAAIQHGLVAATADLPASIQWAYLVNQSLSVGSTLPAYGTGSVNTDSIIAQNGTPLSGYAAGTAKAYISGVYLTWYLPSKDELNKLYPNQAAIGGFSGTQAYWSSTEGSATTAWAQNMYGAGLQFQPAGKGVSILVRPVHSF